MGDSEAGLWLIGIGPGDLSLMTFAAVDRAKRCTHRFLEGYTAQLPRGGVEELEELVGPLTMVMRGGVEDPREIFALAESEPVALLVVGDPLQATTHVDLQMRADEAGIKCEVIHGISVTSIVTGAVGLQSYRFGRQVTLAYPYGDYLATSPMKLIALNRRSGLHTLVLLDLDPTGMGEGEQKPMTPRIAVDVIRRCAELLELDTSDWKIVLCSDMGRPTQQIRCGSIDEIAWARGGSLHCLVIPGRLDEMEKKALDRWLI